MGIVPTRRMENMPFGFGMPSPSYTSASGDYIARSEANCDGYTYLETMEECDLAAADLGLPDRDSTVLNALGEMQATGLQRGCILFMQSHLFFNLQGLDAGTPNPLGALTICKVAPEVTEAPTTTEAAPTTTEASVPVTPVDQSLECRSWCAESSKAWDQKCTWQSCEGCSSCSAPAPSPSAEITTTVAPVGVCRSWCADSPTPWDQKCVWASGACSGCAECETVVIPLDNCMSWCADEAAPWETKCSWPSGKCSGCSECDQVGL